MFIYLILSLLLFGFKSTHKSNTEEERKEVGEVGIEYYFVYTFVLIKMLICFIEIKILFRLMFFVVGNNNCRNE